MASPGDDAEGITGARRQRFNIDRRRRDSAVPDAPKKEGEVLANTPTQDQRLHRRASRR
jgi:hypothetical protein